MGVLLMLAVILIGITFVFFAIARNMSRQKGIVNHPTTKYQKDDVTNDYPPASEESKPLEEVKDNSTEIPIMEKIETTNILENPTDQAQLQILEATENNPAEISFEKSEEISTIDNTLVNAVIGETQEKEEINTNQQSTKQIQLETLEIIKDSLPETSYVEFKEALTIAKLPVHTLIEDTEEYIEINISEQSTIVTQSESLINSKNEVFENQPVDIVRIETQMGDVPATEIQNKRDVQPQETSVNVLNNEKSLTDQPNPQRNKNTIVPEKRGGATRGKRTKTTNEIPSEKIRRARKPEIICWQQSRKWFIGIEKLSEDVETSEVAVKQANTQLTKMPNANWKILDLFETVDIKISSTNDEWNIQLAENHKNPFLLFKLSGEDLNYGRRIHYATSGTYLVITPKDWTRDEKKSGIPQIQSSDCHLNDYQAHYFHLDSNDDKHIAFLTPKNQEIQIPDRKSRFDLVGCKIDDANIEMGQLFGQRLPFLTANDQKILSEIETIVIGEEGKSRDGWRTWFNPEIKDGKIDLLPYFQNIDAGWFYLRIYDSKYELMDSLDFRFVKSLHNITVDKHSVFPSETGHQSVKITLGFDEVYPCKLQPIKHHMKTKKENESKIEIDVLPQPEYDRTNWTITSSTKAEVSILLLVERVWWTCCKRDIPIEQSQWQATPSELKIEYLQATSEYVLRIRFPKLRWINEVQIGFLRGQARTYRVEVTKQTIDIPLNEFEGVNQLEDSSKEFPLFLWLVGYPQQLVAILSISQPTQKDFFTQKEITTKNYIHISLKLDRLIKYLNRLARRIDDDSLSELINQCTRKWLSQGTREHRELYLIETACVIALSWKLLKVKKMKVIGRRKGWIRSFVRIAESNPPCYDATISKYYTLTDSQKITQK